MQLPHVYARARSFASAAPLPAAARGMAPGSPAIRAIEVVQATQSAGNAVRLIADKATVVRAHIDPASVPHEGVLTGELE